MDARKSKPRLPKEAIKNDKRSDEHIRLMHVYLDEILEYGERTQKRLQKLIVRAHATQVKGSAKQ